MAKQVAIVLHGEESTSIDVQTCGTGVRVAGMGPELSGKTRDVAEEYRQVVNTLL